jgi:hypothetical protein
LTLKGASKNTFFFHWASHFGTLTKPQISRHFLMAKEKQRVCAPLDAERPPTNRGLVVDSIQGLVVVCRNHQL